MTEHLSFEWTDCMAEARLPDGSVHPLPGLMSLEVRLGLDRSSAHVVMDGRQPQMRETVDWLALNLPFVSSMEVIVETGTSATRYEGAPAYDVDRTRYCHACDVTWRGGLHCWSCGEEGEPSSPPEIKDQEVTPYGWGGREDLPF